MIIQLVYNILDHFRSLMLMIIQLVYNILDHLKSYIPTRHDLQALIKMKSVICILVFATCTSSAVAADMWTEGEYTTWLPPYLSPYRIQAKPDEVYYCHMARIRVIRIFFMALQFEIRYPGGQSQNGTLIFGAIDAKAGVRQYIIAGSASAEGSRARNLELIRERIEDAASKLRDKNIPQAAISQISCGVNGDSNDPPKLLEINRYARVFVLY